MCHIFSLFHTHLVIFLSCISLLLPVFIFSGCGGWCSSRLCVKLTYQSVNNAILLNRQSEIRTQRVQSFVSTISPLCPGQYLLTLCFCFAFSLCSCDLAQELGVGTVSGSLLLVDEGWPLCASSCWQSRQTGGGGGGGRSGGGFVAPSESRVRGQTLGPRVPPLVA